MKKLHVVNININGKNVIFNKGFTHTSLISKPYIRFFLSRRTDLTKCIKSILTTNSIVYDVPNKPNNNIVNNNVYFSSHIAP